MNDLFEILLEVGVFLGYIGLCYLVVRWLSKLSLTINPYIRMLTISFVYALVFGLGIFGGEGGEPGFAIPLPVIAVLFLGLTDIWGFANMDYFVVGALLPWAFWWILIFVVMLIRHLILKRVKARANKTQIKRVVGGN